MATSNNPQERDPGEASGAAAASPQSPASSHKRRRDDTHSQSPSFSEDGETGSPAHRSATPTEPPLPEEEAPPLPDEAPPEDDGWDALWDHNAQAYYFYNRFTQATQWENPRVPGASGAPYGSYDRFA
jgi:hypothetical protein